MKKVFPFLKNINAVEGGEGMCVHKTEEGLCRKYSIGGDTSYCVEGPCPDEVPSNADRIRSMSDEELAEWVITKAPSIGKNYTDSVLGLKEWIRQPAQQENIQ